MRLVVVAVGRMKPGPERDLLETYMDRATKTGRQLGLGPVDVIEIDERKATTQDDEFKALDQAIPQGAKRIVLDERGKLMTSPDFARTLADWRDHGTRDVALIIGGADGHTQDMRNSADLTLSLGKMVWPHMLARVMLAEQLYRATSILAGQPYHRS